MATPDPRRGDGPGEPIVPASAPREEDEQPAHDGVSPAFDEKADDPDAVTPEDTPRSTRSDRT